MMLVSIHRPIWPRSTPSMSCACGQSFFLAGADVKVFARRGLHQFVQACFGKTCTVFQFSCEVFSARDFHVETTLFCQKCIQGQPGVLISRSWLPCQSTRLVLQDFLESLVIIIIIIIASISTREQWSGIGFCCYHTQKMKRAVRLEPNNRDG